MFSMTVPVNKWVSCKTIPSEGAQRVLLDGFDIVAVVQDLALLDIVEAVDEVRDRRLARAGGADKGDLLPWTAVQVDVMQDDLLLVVAEVHILKDDVALPAWYWGLPSASMRFHAHMPVDSFVSVTVSSAAYLAWTRVMSPSLTSGFSSSSAKIRAPPASAITTEFSCMEIWLIGWLNWRVSTRKLARPPSVKPPKPLMASAPPRMAQNT